MLHEKVQVRCVDQNMYVHVDQLDQEYILLIRL